MGVPSPAPGHWIRAAAAGLAAAVVYALSPLTVWVAIGAAALVVAARRGLPDRERRALLALLAAAFALRAAVVAGIFLATPHDSQSAAVLFGDEAYTMARALRIRNVLLGIPALKYDHIIAFEDYGRTSYLWVVTAAQLLFGPSPYGLRLLNVLFFAAAAVLLHRLARRAFGPLPALVGLTLLLFLPTWLFWSVSLLKESLYFLLAAVTLGAVASLGSPSTPDPRGAARAWTRRSLLIAAAAGAVLLLRDLRGGALILMLASLGLGLGLYVLTASRRRFIAGTAAILVAGALLLSRPAVQDRLLDGLTAAARQHIGHVFTVGHSYKLLDDGFYVSLDLEPTLTFPEALRFAARAVVSFVVVPLPHQVTTRGGLVQLPEHLLWYVMLLLAPAGIAAGLRRDRLLTCLLIGFIVPTALVVAMTNGNVGTLVRFRGLVTPYLAWLAALGFCVIMQRLLVSSGAPVRPAAPLREARDHV